jgi:hypothetical protein
MSEMRPKPSSTRLEQIRALIGEASARERITNAQRSELILNALANATNLTAQTSKGTFRSECKLALRANEIAGFDAIVSLAKKMWHDGNINRQMHGEYHLIMCLCRKIAGGRGVTKLTLRHIENYYNRRGVLPP